MLNIKEIPGAFFSYVRSKQKGKGSVISLRDTYSDNIIVKDVQGLAYSIF